MKPAFPATECSNPYHHARTGFLRYAQLTRAWDATYCLDRLLPYWLRAVKLAQPWLPAWLLKIGQLSKAAQAAEAKYRSVINAAHKRFIARPDIGMAMIERNLQIDR